jgi:hypothetical protein
MSVREFSLSILLVIYFNVEEFILWKIGDISVIYLDFSRNQVGGY